MDFDPTSTNVYYLEVMDEYVINSFALIDVDASTVGILSGSNAYDFTSTNYLRKANNPTLIYGTLDTSSARNSNTLMSYQWKKQETTSFSYLAGVESFNSFFIALFWFNAGNHANTFKAIHISFDIFSNPVIGWYDLDYGAAGSFPLEILVVKADGSHLYYGGSTFFYKNDGGTFNLPNSMAFASRISKYILFPSTQAVSIPGK